MVPRRVVHQSQIRLGGAPGWSVRSCASGRNAGDMRSVAADTGVGIGGMVVQRSVRIGLFQRPIDGIAIMKDAVAERLWGAGLLAAALVPQSEDARGAIRVPE